MTSNQQQVPFDDVAAAEVHATYIAIWDREADRFWVRSNLMLLVNGALLGVVTGAQTPSALKLFLCAFGVYFSIHWLLVNGKGAYYVGRWRPAIEKYERSLAHRGPFSHLPLSTVAADPVVIVPAKTAAERLGILRGSRPPVRDAAMLMHAIILGFVAVWISLGVYFAVVAAEKVQTTSRAGHHMNPAGQYRFHRNPSAGGHPR